MSGKRKDLLWKIGLPAAVVLLGGLLAWGGAVLSRNVWLRPAERETEEALAVDTPCEGVGRAPSAARYLGAVEETPTASLWIVCEDDPDLPEWWNPDEAVLVWSDAPKKDIACPDWDIETSLVGWDGRKMEVWEMELFSRIVYLEFWGTSPECCEAGADSILRLWESGYFGNTIGDVLSARAENGARVYTTYGYVWEWDYDAEGLADMRALCEARFASGPAWEAAFFQLGGYPAWACPMYEIDGVYFSTGKGWQ